ncbi:hypothetical protein A55 [Sulfolobus turreted icosahedral virus 1]|jgi:flagellar biosynthesis/type III secretory pathway M-ring protein FliF/YscJ|uniref:Uncharacterized protein n=1 Tax=Sulfolobus turreted icosahedral virus 1 TaxID=269145 RepID=Q6Q0M0_9VIRU|nr:hypothetical protein A55 [Sulfolobus turreted icosahedral virus 1]AAS89071.1 hypothetical protein A55 [Sulfolobus turreted icosahedral virus 1]
MNIEEIQYEVGQEDQIPPAQTKTVVVQQNPKLFGISVWIWIIIILVLILLVLIIK